jgi:SAM-dependent methyltransferase
MQCAVCGSPMAGPRHGHYFRCPDCRFRASDLPPVLHDARAHAALDEGARLEGLRALRARNFDRILDALGPVAPGGAPRLLDVGSGHGWFLEAAAARGYAVTGLEPDAAVAAVAGPVRERVIDGRFPQDLPAGETFDVITFHDVFEHLPDPGGVLDACRARLRGGGALVISLPDSGGTLFRMAELLAGLGARAPLHRFWQRGFPSPHVSYFSAATLPALTRANLWQRLRLDRQGSLAAAAAAWVALQLALPVLGWLPQDAVALVFRQADGPPAASAVA